MKPRFARNSMTASPPSFDRMMVIHDVEFRGAALNMAIDEALLANSSAPILRFYRWDHPAVSFGYFGRLADLAPHHATDVVRRWTGGGIVFHGDDLTYALIIPATELWFGASASAIYEHSHRAIQRTLRRAGVKAELAFAETDSDRASEIDTAVRPLPGFPDKHQCFVNPVRADVMVEQQKIAGAAQRRTARGLLQQGSIQKVELPQGFEVSFARELARVSDEQPLSDQILDSAAQLAKAKYATDQWLRKR
jgi:lipoate-protein ligase A